MKEFWEKVTQIGLDEKTLRKAFEFSRNAHEGQKRVGGEDYFTHPLNVAKILLDSDYAMPEDANMIAAALLHDTIEDTDTTYEDLKREFGEDVQNLVNSLTKIDNEDGSTNRVETHKKILDEGTKDKRVFYIKLADVLHNLHTLHALPNMQRKRMANEVVAFHLPIAKKMNLNKFEFELVRMTDKYLKN